MTNLSATVTTVLVVALVVALVVFWLMRGGKLTKFDLQLHKLFRFTGEAHVESANGGGKAVAPADNDDAEKVMLWLYQRFDRIDGSYILTESTSENARAVAQLYARLRGSIIATAFFESPNYGEADYASLIPEGTMFTRVTLESVCDSVTASAVSSRLSAFACRGRLVVVPTAVKISKIGGIFCRLPDKSHLAFVALNNVDGSDKNQGLVFCGVLARALYDYYGRFTREAAGQKAIA